jgi:hypothetical protein
VALVLTARLATLDELRTIYGPSDLYLLFEIAAVESHNRAVAAILPNRR